MRLGKGFANEHREGMLDLHTDIEGFRSAKQLLENRSTIQICGTSCCHAFVLQKARLNWQSTYSGQQHVEI